MRNLSAVLSQTLSTKTLSVWAFVVILLAMPLTSLSFGQSAGNDTHLYFFTSKGCAPCEMVKPSLAKLDAEGYPVTIVDIRERPDWANHFRVDRTPTVIMVRDQQIVGRHAGVIGYDELLQWFTTSGYVPSRDAVAAKQAGTQVAIRDAESRSNVGAQATATQVQPIEPTGNLNSDTPEFQSATMHKGTSTPANDFEERALDATVKIKVEDDEGISYATGTVVHSHGNESLVVTCGHVFRESQGKGEISGEYGFSNGVTKNAAGELIFYDADARDIALLVLKTNGDTIPAVEIASKRTTVSTGEDAFSIGCDHGESPTIRHTRIKNKAAYDGAIKYDIYGRPVNGRSGGGLFTDDGHLIGVCNAAVVDVDEGIYTALDTIHWQFEHTHLAHLFDSNPTGSPIAAPTTAPTTAPATTIASAEFTSPAPINASPIVRPSVEFPRSTPRPTGRSSLVSLRGDEGDSGQSVDSGSEVLIIVRSKDDQGTAKTITLQNPSHRLIDYLENMPPVKSEVRQLDAANYRQASSASDQFRKRVQRGSFR